MGARPPTFAQSPRRQPHQEGVTETSVSVEMGASKTVPPASTREEPSSLQIRKPLRVIRRRFSTSVRWANSRSTGIFERLK